MNPAGSYRLWMPIKCKWESVHVSISLDFIRIKITKYYTRVFPTNKFLAENRAINSRRKKKTQHVHQEMLSKETAGMLPKESIRRNRYKKSYLIFHTDSRGFNLLKRQHLLHWQSFTYKYQGKEVSRALKTKHLFITINTENSYLLILKYPWK